MANPSTPPAWQQALVVTAGTTVTATVVLFLYWAQIICIPLAMAIFLTFLLAPLVSACQRWGLKRGPAVIAVVTLAALALAGVVWLVTSQLHGLMEDLPSYTNHIKNKVRTFQEMTQGSGTERFTQMLQDVLGELKSTSESPSGGSDQGGGVETEKPTPVVVKPEGPAWMSWVPSFFRSVGEAFASALLSIVLVVFMLVKREDLRNRLIWLMGRGRVTVTTKAVEEAGHRISRFLLMQAILNSAYGVVLAVGLALIEVKYALLWGFLAAVFRYIPYLGVWLSAVPTILLSLAQFPGWTQPLLVIGLFLVLEVITPNVIEPLVYGQSMGVSEVALLVGAAFLAFLWGPVGMVLSSPVIVCLVVLGRYVPRLEFLDVLLGDEPALDTNVSFYQRLLARDQDEATELVLETVRTGSAEQIYDDLLVPALNYAKKDLERGDLSEADECFVLRAVRDIISDLGEQRAATAPATAPPEGKPPARGRILGCPARDEADQLGLAMFAQLLDRNQWEVEMISADALAAEVLEHVAESEPALICISSLPPGGLAHTRYLCKRLRTHFPNVKILVGRWGLHGNPSANQEQLREAGADVVTTTLLETRAQVNAWRPVVAQAPEADSAREGGKSLQKVKA